jgi:hypothetical protein
LIEQGERQGCLFPDGRKLFLGSSGPDDARDKPLQVSLRVDHAGQCVDPSVEKRPKSEGHPEVHGDLTRIESAHSESTERGAGPVTRRGA